MSDSDTKGKKMKTRLKFTGLNELMKQLEELADEKEIRQTNKKIFKRAVKYSQPVMQSHIPKSSDNSKSGKRGYRPTGHAADNVPIEATTTHGIVGWEILGDAGNKRNVGNWFYIKFVEWGTTRQKPQDFLKNTRKESESAWSNIAEDEYQKFLDSKLK